MKLDIIALQQKSMDEQRRKTKYQKTRDRIWLRIFEYKSVGKRDKAIRLIEKIEKKFFTPCKFCGK